MRMTVGQVVEARLCWIPALDQTCHLLGRPVRDVTVLRQVPRSIQILVVVHASGEHPTGVALIRQVEFVVVYSVELRTTLFVKDDVVEADPVSLRIDVKLAGGEGLVAVVAERLGKCGDIRHPQSLVEVAVTVGAAGRPRHQRPTSGDTDRAFAVGPWEAATVSGELIERRGLDRRVTGDAEE